MDKFIQLSKNIKAEYILPNLGDIVFILILYLLLYLKPDMLFTDGSTGWHLVTGNYILQHNCVPHTDLMSYTFPDKPWVAYEWLCDVFMAILTRLGGLNLLYVAVTITIASIILFLYNRCRQKGCNFVIALILTICGALLSSIHWLARPHLFTFLGVIIFVTQLDRFYEGLLSGKKLLIYLFAYMLIWTNTHPGFLLGLALIILYLFSSIISFIFLKQNTETDKLIMSKKKISTLFLACWLTCLASLCSPYGLKLYSYISHYLFKTQAVIVATDEFQSPVFHGAFQPSILELLFAATFLGLIITRSRINLPNILVYLMFAHLSLSAQRNMALFVFANLPFIAYLFANTKLDLPDGTIYAQLKQVWQFCLNKFTQINNRFTENEKNCSYHLLPIIISILLIVIALNGGKVFGLTVLNADFADNKPNKTLALIKEMRLDPKHGFSMDNWGGVIRYKINYPVFIDDRADFYGEEFYIEYGKIFLANPGWQKLLDKYKIEWVLLPPKSRLIEELKEDKHWQIKGKDSAAILMVKESSAHNQNE